MENSETDGWQVNEEKNQPQQETYSAEPHLKEVSPSSDSNKEQNSPSVDKKHRELSFPHAHDATVHTSVLSYREGGDSVIIELPVGRTAVVDRASGSHTRLVNVLPAILETTEEAAVDPEDWSPCSSSSSSPVSLKRHCGVFRVSSKPALTSISEEQGEKVLVLTPVEPDKEGLKINRAPLADEIRARLEMEISKLKNISDESCEISLSETNTVLDGATSQSNLATISGGSSLPELASCILSDQLIEPSSHKTTGGQAVESGNTTADVSDLMNTVYSYSDANGVVELSIAEDNETGAGEPSINMESYVKETEPETVGAMLESAYHDSNEKAVCCLGEEQFLPIEDIRCEEEEYLLQDSQHASVSDYIANLLRECATVCHDYADSQNEPLSAKSVNGETDESKLETSAAASRVRGSGSDPMIPDSAATNSNVDSQCPRESHSAHNSTSKDRLDKELDAPTKNRGGRECGKRKKDRDERPLAATNDRLTGMRNATGDVKAGTKESEVKPDRTRWVFQIEGRDAKTGCRLEHQTHLDQAERLPDTWSENQQDASHEPGNDGSRGSPVNLFIKRRSMQRQKHTNTSLSPTEMQYVNGGIGDDYDREKLEGDTPNQPQHEVQEHPVADETFRLRAFKHSTTFEALPVTVFDASHNHPSGMPNEEPQGDHVNVPVKHEGNLGDRPPCLTSEVSEQDEENVSDVHEPFKCLAKGNEQHTSNYDVKVEGQFTDETNAFSGIGIKEERKENHSDMCTDKCWVGGKERDDLDTVETGRVNSEASNDSQIRRQDNAQMDSTLVTAQEKIERDGGFAGYVADEFHSSIDRCHYALESIDELMAKMEKQERSEGKPDEMGAKDDDDEMYDPELYQGISGQYAVVDKAGDSDTIGHEQRDLNSSDSGVIGGGEEATLEEPDKDEDSYCEAHEAEMVAHDTVDKTFGKKSWSLEIETLNITLSEAQSAMESGDNPVVISDQSIAENKNAVEEIIHIIKETEAPDDEMKQKLHDELGEIRESIDHFQHGIEEMQIKVEHFHETIHQAHEHIHHLQEEAETLCGILQTPPDHGVHSEDVVLNTGHGQEAKKKEIKVKETVKLTGALSLKQDQKVDQAMKDKAQGNEIEPEQMTEQKIQQDESKDRNMLHKQHEKQSVLMKNMKQRLQPDATNELQETETHEFGKQSEVNQPDHEENTALETEIQEEVIQEEIVRDDANIVREERNPEHVRDEINNKEHNKEGDQEKEIEENELDRKDEPWVYVDSKDEQLVYVDPKDEQLVYVDPKDEQLVYVDPKDEQLVYMDPKDEQLVYVDPKDEQLVYVDPKDEQLVYVDPKDEQLVCVDPKDEQLVYVDPKDEQLVYVDPKDEQLIYVDPKDEQLVYVDPKDEQLVSVAKNNEQTIPVKTTELPSFNRGDLLNFNEDAVEDFVRARPGSDPETTDFDLLEEIESHIKQQNFDETGEVQSREQIAEPPDVVNTGEVSSYDQYIEPTVVIEHCSSKRKTAREDDLIGINELNLDASNELAELNEFLKSPLNEDGESEQSKRTDLEPTVEHIDIGEVNSYRPASMLRSEEKPADEVRSYTIQQGTLDDIILNDDEGVQTYVPSGREEPNFSGNQDTEDQSNEKQSAGDYAPANQEKRSGLLEQKAASEQYLDDSQCDEFPSSEPCPSSSDANSRENSFSDTNLSQEAAHFHPSSQSFDTHIGDVGEKIEQLDDLTDGPTGVPQTTARPSESGCGEHFDDESGKQDVQVEEKTHLAPTEEETLLSRNFSAATIESQIVTHVVTNVCIHSENRAVEEMFERKDKSILSDLEFGDINKKEGITDFLLPEKQQVTAEEVPSEPQKITAEELPCELQKVTAEEVPSELQKITAEELPSEPQKITAEELPSEPEKITAEELPSEPQKITAEELPSEPEKITAEELPSERQLPAKEIDDEGKKAPRVEKADFGGARPKVRHFVKLKDTSTPQDPYLAYIQRITEAFEQDDRMKMKQMAAAKHASKKPRVLTEGNEQMSKKRRRRMHEESDAGYKDGTKDRELEDKQRETDGQPSTTCPFSDHRPTQSSPGHVHVRKIDISDIKLTRSLPREITPRDKPLTKTPSKETRSASQDVIKVHPDSSGIWTRVRKFLASPLKKMTSDTGIKVPDSRVLARVKQGESAPTTLTAWNREEHSPQQMHLRSKTASEKRNQWRRFRRLHALRYGSERAYMGPPIRKHSATIGLGHQLEFRIPAHREPRRSRKKQSTNSLDSVLTDQTQESEMTTSTTETTNAPEVYEVFYDGAEEESQQQPPSSPPKLLPQKTGSKSSSLHRQGHKKQFTSAGGSRSARTSRNNKSWMCDIM